MHGVVELLERPDFKNEPTVPLDYVTPRDYRISRDGALSRSYKILRPPREERDELLVV